MTATRKRKNALGSYERRLIKRSRMHHLGEDDYEAFVNALRIERPFASREAAAKAFAASLRKACVDGYLMFEDFARALADIPALDDSAFRKILREIPSEREVRRGAGSSRTALEPHVQRIADSITSTRPDISRPELAGMIFECLLTAGAPAILFREGSKTVEGWLKG